MDLNKMKSRPYGDYEQGAKCAASILKALNDAHEAEHGEAMTFVQMVKFSDIIRKLIRLAVTPDHLDSWEDIAGYANLISKGIKDASGTKTECQN